MQIQVQIDTSGLRAGLRSEQQRLARVLRRTVNAAAFGALNEVREEIRTKFDRPTPWVLNGPYVVPAKDGDQFAGTEARIAWREFAGKGVPAQKILRAQIEGGARRLKSFERLIGLPSNRVAVPGRWAPLDAYGNIPGPFIVQVLSDLRLFGEVGFVANRVRTREETAAIRRIVRGTRQRARRSRFFMVPVGSEDRQLSPGIYRIDRQRGGAPLLVIAFVRAAQYRPRIAPARTAARYVEQNIAQLWRQGLAGTLPFYNPRTGISR